MLGSLILCAISAPQAASAEANYKRLSNVLAVALPLTAGMWSVASHDKEGLRQLALSETATLAITMGIKYTVDAERPNRRNRDSFPSGHASTAFAAARHLHLRAGPHFGIPSYVVAGLVGYSRVKAREHRMADVIAGAALGIVSSQYLTVRRDDVQWGMAVAPDRLGIHYAFEWQ